MYQVDVATASPGLPTPAPAGTPGFYNNGDPSLGVARTVWEQDMANMLMLELINLIGTANAVAGAGITLSKTNYVQVAAAVQALIAAAISGSANVMFSTGDVKMTIKTVADTGWLMMNDGTIGNGASGANYANALAGPLYTLLWNNVSDTYAPVSTGRGLSAAADFAAGKAIALTKVLGRALASAGAGSGLTSRALGQTEGEETHVLATGEMPAHNHPLLVNPGSGPVPMTSAYPVLTFNASLGPNAPSGGGNWQGASITMGDTGGGAAHNNMQPTAHLNLMIKL